MLVGFNDMSSFQGTLTPNESAFYNRDIGANAVRVGGSVAQVEAAWPSRAAGWNLDNFTPKPYYDAWSKAGLKIVPIIGDPPAWMASHISGVSAPDRVLLAQFWRDVTLRWPNVVALEVYNEPNLNFFWPSPNAATYVGVLSAIYSTIETVPIIGGAFSHYQGGAQGIALSTYLDSFFAAGGGAVCDAYSIHPYPYELGTTDDPAGTGEWWRGTAATINLLNTKSISNLYPKSIWVTELGQNVPFNVTEAEQAKSLPMFYDWCEQHPLVEAVFFHTLMEQAAETAEYAVLRENKTKRPAYRALQDRLGASVYRST
jgi:hypothetical protein